MGIFKYICQTTKLLHQAPTFLRHKWSWRHTTIAYIQMVHYTSFLPIHYNFKMRRFGVSKSTPSLKLLHLIILLFQSLECVLPLLFSSYNSNLGTEEGRQHFIDLFSHFVTRGPIVIVNLVYFSHLHGYATCLNVFMLIGDAENFRYNTRPFRGKVAKRLCFILTILAVYPNLQTFIVSALTFLRNMNSIRYSHWIWLMGPSYRDYTSAHVLIAIWIGFMALHGVSCLATLVAFIVIVAFCLLHFHMKNIKNDLEMYVSQKNIWCHLRVVHLLNQVMNDACSRIITILYIISFGHILSKSLTIFRLLQSPQPLSLGKLAELQLNLLMFCFVVWELMMTAVEITTYSQDILTGMRKKCQRDVLGRKLVASCLEARVAIASFFPCHNHETYLDYLHFVLEQNVSILCIIK